MGLLMKPLALPACDLRSVPEGHTEGCELGRAEGESKSLKTVQLCFGHSGFRTLERYTHKDVQQGSETKTWRYERTQSWLASLAGYPYTEDKDTGGCVP